MIRNFLRNLMVGRYGPDHLNIAMIVFSLALNLIHAIIGFAPVMYLAFAMLLLAFSRMLSRNIARRRAENDRFIRYWWPIRTKLTRTWANLKHRKTHRFVKCPGCANTLRIPKGKGRLQITCPKCGERFVRKT